MYVDPCGLHPEVACELRQAELVHHALLLELPYGDMGYTAVPQALKIVALQPQGPSPPLEGPLHSRDGHGENNVAQVSVELIQVLVKNLQAPVVELQYVLVTSTLMLQSGHSDLPGPRVELFPPEEAHLADSEGQVIPDAEDGDPAYQFEGGLLVHPRRAERMERLEEISDENLVLF